MQRFLVNFGSILSPDMSSSPLKEVKEIEAPGYQLSEWTGSKRVNPLAISSHFQW